MFDTIAGAPFSAGANPVYNNMPTTPPGLAGIPYMISPFMGGTPRPYVPPNMGRADAMIAQRINNPQYQQLMGQVYSQMYSQLGNTVGGMKFVDSISQMTGYNANQIQKDLTNLGSSFGATTPGQMLAPMLDQMMSGAGVSGGSMIGMMDAINSQRFNLLGSGTYYSPTNIGQQHEAMGATSAMFSLMNGLMSRFDDNGNMSLMANQAVTKGFDRDYISRVMMKAAGRGMFNSNVEGALDGYGKQYSGNFSQQLSEITDGVDLSALTYDDFSGGKDSIFRGETAKKMKAFGRSIAAKQQAITETMAAFKELTGTVDGIDEQLDKLTGGSWLNNASNANSTRDALYRLKAVSNIYNVDPNQALNIISQNQSVMQAAAGFDPSLTQLGFASGGMFGLDAQAQLFSNVQDMITRRGVRGDTAAESRLMYQAVTAAAKNQNTSAGRGAQILAYARQTGAISEEEANTYKDLLQSGDRSVMDDGLNRLLTTVYGSEKRGRELMNDRMYMQSMQMRLTDESGAWARNVIERGAVTEMLDQEKQVAAQQRLDYSKSAVKDAGKKTAQSAEQVSKIVDSVGAALADIADVDENGNKVSIGEEYGVMFREQVQERIARGEKPEAALRATVNSFKKNSATAKYASTIELAVKRQTAKNYEVEFGEAGTLEGMQAKALGQALVRDKWITGKQGSEINKLVRAGKGADALALADSAIAKLSPAQQRLYRELREDTEAKYKSQQDVIWENQAVDDLLEETGQSAYGSGAIEESLRTAIDAANTYMADPKSETANEDFWSKLQGSKIQEIFGDKYFQKYLTAVNKGDKDFFKKMGRVSVRFGELAPKVLSENGYDLHYTNFFNQGLYAGNSPLAEAQRNQMVEDLAATYLNDSQLSAEDANTLAQDAVEFLSGTKDLRGVLKQVDSKGNLTSELEDFLDANDKYKEAEASYGKVQRKYYNNMNKLHDSKDTRMTYDYIKDIVDGGALDQHNLDDIDKALAAGNVKSVIGDEGVAEMREALKSRFDMGTAQQAAEGKMSEALHKENVPQWIKALKTKKEMATTRQSRQTGRNAETYAFMDDLDTRDAAVSKDIWGFGNAKLGSAWDSLYDYVKDDDVAKKLGLDSSKQLTKQEWTETALSVVKEKAAGGDEGAQKVIDKFTTAMNEGTTRIRGELIIKNGNESSPAMLDANAMGGGLAQ